MIPYVKESSTPTTNVFLCFHGGGYKITGSQTKALDGTAKLLIQGDTIAPTGSPPCAAPSTGLAVCGFNAGVNAISKKKKMNTGDQFMRTTNIQISDTNGMFAVAPKLTNSAKARGL